MKMSLARFCFWGIRSQHSFGVCLAAPTIVMSPAHCYFDDTAETETLVPQFYQNATAQIGRCALKSKLYLAEKGCYSWLVSRRGCWHLYGLHDDA